MVTSIIEVFVLWAVASVHSSVVHVYVSPTGSDSNTGRDISHPVKTLHHVLRMLDDDGIAGNTVFVEMMKGYYDLRSTLHFTSSTGEVIFRSYQGQEVHVTGGKRVASTQFHRVTDTHVLQRLPQAARAKVLELDLTAAGITDLGILRTFGFEISWYAPMEIFINGRPLRLAEWPNNNFINIKSVPDGEKGYRFSYDSDHRDGLWAQETEPWVYGWWYWSWQDYAHPISHLDPHTHTITLNTTSPCGLRVGHYDPSMQNAHIGYTHQGGYFRVINMLCEIDQPGEYYIDRTNKKLYVWPNTPHQTLTATDIVYLSMASSCIRIEKEAPNLHFQDFTLEACRYLGIQLNSARNITFSNMEIKNTGGRAVTCLGDCRDVSVLASDIHDVCGGVFLRGGNRTDLTPSGIVIRDNHIWDHARYGAQPNNAVHVYGVGSLVSHNHLHHGQYSGVRWDGNDHIMEYNHVHHMCWNASDCGAFHSTRDWTWRGNVIRYNHVHDTQRHVPGASVRGVMLDDEYSSVLIEKNVFYDNDVHCNIGGGRDNVIRDNIMYNALTHSVHLDGRGLGPKGHGAHLRVKLQKSPYRTSLWKTRYPELYDILDHHPEAPEGNQIYENVFYNPAGNQRIYYAADHSLHNSGYFDVHDNHKTFYKDDFSSPDNADFRLRCDSAQWANQHHFPTPVTLDQVGPTVPTGPTYLQKNRQAPATHTTATSSPADCDRPTVAPATSTPRGSYMPDGTSPNTLYPHISKTGCWLIVDHCPSHRRAEGTHQDSTGTDTHTEEGCLARASQQWHWCGSPDNGRVIAVYGPTGAMTFSAKGCYFAEWGCRGPRPGLIHHDTYAEQHENASISEAACLRRASAQWKFCGSHPDRPYTSIYGPTGAFRTAGAGCWIKLPTCPSDHTLEGYFFDAWGDTNRHTGTEKQECFERANDYWSQCGSHDNATVTAYFRPTGSSRTFP